MGRCESSQLGKCLKSADITVKWTLIHLFSDTPKHEGTFAEYTQQINNYEILGVFGTQAHSSPSTISNERGNHLGQFTFVWTKKTAS